MGRHRGEVHRRCRDGGLRRARVARGRRRARGARRSPGRPRRPGAERGRARARSGPPGGGHHRGSSRDAWYRDGGPRQHRNRRRRHRGGSRPGDRPRRRRGGRRGNAPRHAARRRVCAARSGFGPDRGRTDVARHVPPRRLWIRRRPAGLRAVHRPEGRARPPEGDVRARDAAGLGAARHRGGRARGRQEPPGPRVPHVRRLATRARALAAGPVSPLRRWHHVLGARGDRQEPGRDPGIGQPGRGRRQAFPGHRGHCGGSGGAGLAQDAPVPSGRRERVRRRRAGGAVRVVRRLAALPRGRRRQPAAGTGLRGRALGRTGAARVPGVPRGLLGRPAVPHDLHDPT